MLARRLQPENLEHALPAGLLPPTGLVPPAPEVTDVELARSVLDGDEEAFALLVARYHRRAFWIAYHVLGRAEDARDVVQEAFIRVHRSLHRYDFARNFYTWFYRIVMNLAIDALRKRRSARAVALDEFGDGIAGAAASGGLGVERTEHADPSLPAEQTETRSQVWSVLDRLDAKFKSVLVLRDIHGLSCREIAPILGVTHATVRWRLHRGRQIFREQWDRFSRMDVPGSAGPDGAEEEMR